MPLPIYRLRRLLAATAVLLTLVVTGMYFYARFRTRNVLKEVPNKIGYDIKQTANGFQISKSEAGRTLFTIQASDVKQFKLNGRAELHKVSIILYGRDASRFDQIYGDDFAYDPKTGNATANGEVQIDLVANPDGSASPDQSTPRELKNTIHLKTRDLVFNKDTGNAWTQARVDFNTPQATGWAVGVHYAGKSNTLTLDSLIHVNLSSTEAAITADHGVITNDPRQAILDHPHLHREAGILEADRATFHLNRDNTVESILATGNVSATIRPSSAKPANEGQSEILTHADEAEFLLTGKESVLRTATLTGHVHAEQVGAQPMQGDAGRAILEFAGQNELQQVHATDGARLEQKASTASVGIKKAEAGSGPQDFELTAPTIDFILAHGHVLERSETSGTAQIKITPSQPPGVTTTSSPSQTIVTAGKFDAIFASESAGATGRNYLSTITGAPDARIVSSTPGQPARVSTSDSLEAKFLPQAGIVSITQSGNFAYSDGQPPDKRMQAWAATAHYTSADQMLILTGAPRVTSGSMATTATTIRINRATGEATADGDVKSTYSQMKEQPDGALLASSSPIHVTSRTLKVQSASGEALYTGNARLWQDANVIQAPSIQFDRDRRFVSAQGTSSTPVLTTLIHVPTKGSSGAKAGQNEAGNPIAITGNRLTYTDSERRAHYEGGVVAKGSDFTASAKTVDAFLAPHSQTAKNQTFGNPGQLERMVAEGNVVIQQPNRRAEGQKLVYTTADDKFVLTGGPPSIFDAEQGKITGVSLTFFRRDDRVLVEGKSGSPVVTQTRVAR